MINKNDGKKALTILTFLMGLVTLLTMMAPLSQVEVLNGVLTLNYKINGFSVFDSILKLMFQLDSSIITIMRLFVVIQLIVSCLTMLGALITHMFYNKRITASVQIGTNLACYIMNIIYMILGICLTGEIEDALYGEQATTDIVTVSYIGLIVATLIVVGIVVSLVIYKITGDEEKKREFYANFIGNNMPNQAIFTNEQNSNKNLQQESATTGVNFPTYTNTTATCEENNMKTVVEVLKQYKELLDNGLIDDADFANLKNKLLNNN